VGTVAVVERDPVADATAGIGAGLELVEVDALVLERAPEPLDEHVVHPRPRLSMEMRTPASLSTSV
jgi:hypothetical protein